MRSEHVMVVGYDFQSRKSDLDKTPSIPSKTVWMHRKTLPTPRTFFLLDTGPLGTLVALFVVLIGDF